MPIVQLGVFAAALALDPPCAALTLSQVSVDTPYDGITITQYRSASPSADVWVAEIDLCTDGVYVDASRASDALQTAGAWGSDRGAQLATNGDFYRTDPVRVYGDAIGDGVAWPLVQTGLDPAYSAEWYWHNYGWIAFGHDSVTFTHTEWVKANASMFGGLSAGWQPTAVAPEPPAGTLALVSGFPELVVEGAVITCPSPTDPTCFPDRSDMRARNPRTAMGLTAGLDRFLLAVVDGRTSGSDGMYGSELADLMGQLGAYEAFNLDGGGSSELWTAADGYLNDVSGNNLGAGTRSIANHWGVLSGADPNRPFRPGHCATADPCGAIGADGGVIDDGDACFRTFGPAAYWRDEADGEGGQLHWTNAWETDAPSNWAWWRLELDEAGLYDVQVYIDADFGVFDAARYVVHADGVDTEVFVDQGASDGWVSLGSATFAAGGDQWVAVYDDASGAVPADQHIVADALQLVRLDGQGTTPGATGDTADTGADTDTTGGPGDATDGTATDTTDSTGAADRPTTVTEASDDAGCGCASAGQGRAGLALLAAWLGAIAGRRRARQVTAAAR